MAATTLTFEGPAGVGSDLVLTISNLIGPPTKIVFSECRGYYVEFDTPSFSAHVCSGKDVDGIWGAVISWAIRDDGPRPESLIQYLESLR